ncbi:MAG TPA: VPLPA-CTERM sorting domain-containing protein [Gammaproteobacteria bacterium]|nr:VPLPA-CTERM sorting domain-containing protein [Gammaproteobacteria bacterium]
MNVKLISAALAAGLLSAGPALSSPVTLDFEGASSFAPVDGFYSALGVSFGGDALAISNDAAGPYYSNAPTPGTIMAPVGPAATMNAQYGFAGDASFYYSSDQAADVNVYSGLDGTGSVLATFHLAANSQNGCSGPFCHWDVASVSFIGTAQSILFGAAASAGIDNVSVNMVPLPAAVWLLLSGLGGIGTFLRRKRIA